jgi:hypothetical protein
MEPLVKRYSRYWRTSNQRQFISQIVVGKRGGIMIVDVADPSKIPAIAEPLFLAFNASTEFHIVMAPEKLARANLEDLGKKYGS